MNNITVSAPGKLMLFGEHSVVYGNPCLTTAVGQRLTATVEILEQASLVIQAKDVGIDHYEKPISELGTREIPKGARFIEFAVKNFLEKYSISGGLRVTTSSEFSSQFGFGSSSASTVCVMKALWELVKQSHDVIPAYAGIRIPDQVGNDERKELFDLSYKTVLDIQGHASGFDAANAIYGGTLYFVGGGKIIEPLLVKQPPLIIGFTGIKADTVTLVKQVALKKQEYPEKMERLFKGITDLVEQAKTALLTSDFERLGKLMDFNQEYLRDLGVSSEKLENLITAAKKTGAYGAKLSGAGGGDCMIAVSSPDKEELVKQAITQAGGQVIEVETGVEGVRIE